MPSNTQSHNRAIVDSRRRLVAQLILRGATQREIVEGLAKQGVINRDSGEPWSLGTINSDVKWLRRQWDKDAKADMASFRAKMLAELSEVKRAAWAKGDLKHVLTAMQHERALLGMDKQPFGYVPPGDEDDIGQDDEAVTGVVLYIPDNGRDLPSPGVKLLEGRPELGEDN